MVVSIAMIIVQCGNNNDKNVIYKSATTGDELRMPSCDFLTYTRFYKSINSSSLNYCVRRDREELLCSRRYFTDGIVVCGDIC